MLPGWGTKIPHIMQYGKKKKKNNNIKRMRRQAIVWKKILAKNAPDKGLLSKIHKELLKKS